MPYTDDYIVDKVVQIYQRKSSELTEEDREFLEEFVVRFDITKDVIQCQKETIDDLKSQFGQFAVVQELVRDNKWLRDQVKDKLGISSKQRQQIEEWKEKHSKEHPETMHSYTYELHETDGSHYLFVGLKCSCGKYRCFI